jgi:hypothetical protein
MVKGLDSFDTDYVPVNNKLIDGVVTCRIPTLPTCFILYLQGTYGWIADLSWDRSLGIVSSQVFIYHSQAPGMWIILESIILTTLLSDFDF